MFNFLFIIKTFALSLLILMLLQVEVGSVSLETHAMRIVRGSSIVEPLRSASRGGAKLLSEGTAYISEQFNSLVRKALPEDSNK
jgi:hypothetical protein